MALKRVKYLFLGCSPFKHVRLLYLPHERRLYGQLLFKVRTEVYIVKA